MTAAYSCIHDNLAFTCNVLRLLRQRLSAFHAVVISKVLRNTLVTSILLVLGTMHSGWLQLVRAYEESVIQRYQQTALNYLYMDGLSQPITEFQERFEPLGADECPVVPAQPGTLGGNSIGRMPSL